MRTAPRIRRFVTDSVESDIERSLLSRAAFHRRLPGVSTRPNRILETIANPNPERNYVIRFECPEFTCLCPKTGQPDFAVIRIEYVPDQLCVELKSWKLYLWSYRDEGAFHEAVTNRLLDDLVGAVKPRRARIEAAFNVRGGIHTVVIAEYPAPLESR